MLKKKSKNSKRLVLTRKYILTILLIVICLSALTISFAWFNGITVRLGSGDDPGLVISRLSSLKENVDVVGYGYNSLYEEGGEESYLVDTTFRTLSEIDKLATGEKESKFFFYGDVFEPGAINKLSTQTTEAVNEVIEANTNTKYLKVTNRSDMDISVKIRFSIADESYSAEDLTGFWYLISDVTEDVEMIEADNDYAKLENFAKANCHTRSNSYNENSVDAKVFTKITSIVKLGDIMEPTEEDENGVTKIYRIDYGLCEQVLRSSGVSYFGKTVKMNINVIYGQIAAPDDEDIVIVNTVREVWTAEDLNKTLRNVNEAYNGDTIRFMADIVYDGTLTITRPFNFDFNGHRLTINEGNLIVEHNSSTAMTFDLTQNGSLYIIGRRSTILQDGINGDIKFNTPNSTVTVLGDYSKESGLEYYDIKVVGSGKIYDGCTSTGQGLLLKNVYIQNYTYNVNDRIYELDDVVVEILEDAVLKIMDKTIVDVIQCEQITKASIYNYGTVGWMNLSSMLLTNKPIQSLYIYNNGYIGSVIDNKARGITLPKSAKPANTTIVKDIYSNNFVLDGSALFTVNDIEDLGIGDVVVPIQGEDYAYRVTISESIPLTDATGNSRLKFALQTYFQSETSYAEIKKLVIVGKKGTFLTDKDIAFLNSTKTENGVTSYVFRDIAYLDMSLISVKDTSYTNVSQQENRIKDNAFLNRTTLTTVILPETVAYIGTNAFNGTGLTAITLPSSVIYVGQNAFANVTDVTIKSYIPISNNYNFLRGFNALNTYFFVHENFVDNYKTQFKSFYPDGQKFSDHVYCFSSRANNNFFVRVLDQDTLSLEIVAYIGDCKDTNVTPGTMEFNGYTYHVTSIGRDAYINMTNLTYDTLALSLGEYVTNIGQEAFYSLSFITSLSGAAVTNIGSRAFYNCDYLEVVTLNSKVTINERAFAECENISVVSLNKCIYIGEYAFQGCSSIENLVIPEVQTLKTGAFSGCYKFQSVVFGKLKEISSGTFNGCTSLTKIVLSSATKTIGDYAFDGCISLNQIASTSAGLTADTLIFDNIIEIGDYAFKGCNNFKYVRSKSLESVGVYAFQNCTKLEYFSAPNVLEIKNAAFNTLSNLTQVDISSCISIGDYAFQKTGLLYIDIPCAQIIGAYAFYNCTNINEISFGNALSIGTGAFVGVQPNYIDMSAYEYPDIENLGIPAEIQKGSVSEEVFNSYVFGGGTGWHNFKSSVKFYYSTGEVRGSQNQIAKKQYIYYVFDLASATKTLVNGEYKYTNLKSNLNIEFIFEKYYFVGSWPVESNDHYLKKNFYLYNVYIDEDNNGEIVTYHGKAIYGNTVIPYIEYLEEGIEGAAFANKNTTYYDGYFPIDVNNNGTIESDEYYPITTIGFYAYENVEAKTNEATMGITGDIYTHIAFANTVKTICEGAFRYSQFEYVDLNNVETIEKDAFRNMEKLIYVDLGNTVTIGEYAFSSYAGTDYMSKLYKAHGNKFYVNSFSTTMLTKVVFRHVDEIKEGAFFYNYVRTSALTILDFTLNAPGLDDSYNSGYGEKQRYNTPTIVDTLWLGYNGNYYYNYNSWNMEYNETCILAPYFASYGNTIKTSFSQIAGNTHLFYDYGYTYHKDYKVNGVEIGMYWLAPANETDVSEGFYIYKSLLRNLGSVNIDNLEYNDETKRYLYTIPSKINGSLITYAFARSETNANKLIDNNFDYDVKLTSLSFKNTTVADGCIVDLKLGDGIDTIPSNCFRFAKFKNIYLNQVKTLSEYAFSYSTAYNIYAKSLETIQNSAFSNSNIRTLDLRDNKKLVNGKYETIYVNFSPYFLYASGVDLIYVNDEDLATYVEKSKGVAIYSSNEDEVELYIYIKAMGTYVGNVRLLNTSSYDLETLLSPYVKDGEDAEIIYTNSNSTVFNLKDGVVSVNANPYSINGDKYTNGETTVYCIKRNYTSRTPLVYEDTLLGKFNFTASVEATKDEYYNFVLSTKIVDETKRGYKIIDYKGSGITGRFDPTERFNEFMNLNVTDADRDTYSVLNYRITDTTYYQATAQPTYTVFEIEQASYMKMSVINDELVFLYTDQYITKIGDYAFYQIPLYEVWLSNVTHVGKRAFKNSTTLKNLAVVVMPKIEIIESEAFYQNAELEYVVVGDMGYSHLTTIGTKAFAECNGIKRFGAINANLTDPTATYTYASSYYQDNHYIVMTSLFNNLESLRTYKKYSYSTPKNYFMWVYQETTYINTNQTITHSMGYYENEVDDYSDDYYFLFIPDSVTSIGAYAFYQLNEIEEARYTPNTAITNVADYALSNCKKLHYVRLSTNIVTIGTNAFSYCESLIDPLYTYASSHTYYTDGINLANIVTIGTRAFKGCYSLSYIYLDKVESIGTEAFDDCESLRYINFESNVPREALSKITFGSDWNASNHPLKRYYVPAAYKSKFADAVYIYVRDNELKNYEFVAGETNGYVLSFIKDQLTQEKQGVKIVCYNGPEIKQVPTTFVIGGYTYPVLTIGAYAYHGYDYNSAVDTMHLPEYVKTVESHAFDGCLFSYYEEDPSLANVTVTYGSYVFKANTMLISAKYVRMESGGSCEYDGCTSFTTMDLVSNYNANGDYAAPKINNDFFTGSPMKAKCAILIGKTNLFTAPGYLGRVFEDSTDVSADGKYQIAVVDSKIVIVRYIGEDAISGDYHIPYTLGVEISEGVIIDYPVVGINMGAFKDISVAGGTKLTIGSNITEIGDYAFYNTKFYEVKFDNSDTPLIAFNITIGEYAFASMTYLYRVDLSKINTLGQNDMFNGDSSLAYAQINTDLSTITAIPDGYFRYCACLESLEISTNITEIGAYAFENCNSLKYIKTKGSTNTGSVLDLSCVKKIGTYAFSGCSNFITLLGFAAEDVGAYAFKECLKLSGINLNSSNIKQMGEGVFYGCVSVSTARAYMNYIPDYCFYGCENVTTVDCGSAKSIGKYAFYNCINITNVNFLSVSSIGDYAFYNCTGLDSFTINQVSYIGAAAFQNCTIHGVLTLPSVTYLGNYAFANNVGLTKVVFYSLLTMNGYVFYQDYNIEEFDFKENSKFINNANVKSAPDTVSSTALSGMLTSTFVIYVPGDTAIIKEYENRFPSWKHRIFEKGEVVSILGVEYMVKLVDNEYEIIRYLGDGLSSTYEVPTKINNIPITKIGRYAFYNALSSSPNTEVLNLGENIISVGDYAFYGFDFKTISMPNVTNIGNYTFYGNGSIEYLSLPSAQTIGTNAFYNCENLQLVRFYESLTSIGYRAFYNCNDLRVVYIANKTTESINALKISPSNTYNNGYLFGDIKDTELTIRVPSGTLSVYRNSKLKYYASIIKEGELYEGDFSYKETSDGIEILAYEGQDTMVTIPHKIGDKRVVRILANAFENSLNLINVRIPDTLVSISSYAFMGNSTIKDVTVFTDPVYSYEYEQHFMSVDGVLFIKDTATNNPTTLVYYPIAKEKTSYNITDSLTSLSTVDTIYENAFYGNTFIESLSIPSNIRYIGENAFAYCPSLTELKFIAPTSGALTVPKLFGSNILTNCNSDLVIKVPNQAALNSFKNDAYFGYYKNRLVVSA